jgi:outer membrane protein insertion porin family
MEKIKLKIINILLKKNLLVKFMLVLVLELLVVQFGFGVKENNFLGKGIGLDTNFLFIRRNFKGKFSVTNPNYKNSDKSIYFNAEAIETDNYKTFGYKTNKTGFVLEQILNI